MTAAVLAGDQPRTVLVSSLPADQRRVDSQELPVSGQLSPPSEARAHALSKAEPPRTEDALLLIYADALDDFERTRIANQNRLRSLRQVKGMEGTPEEARMAGVLEALAGLEHQVTLDLQRAVRKHPLGPWIKGTVGVGEKQGARLLAAIGDPADRRTVSQLWAYCGLHVWHLNHSSADAQDSSVEVPPSHPGQEDDATHQILAGVAPHKMRGQKANWNNLARSRAYVIAESCMKKRTSPYRVVYDEAREKYAESVHPVPCVRCGPKGRPAPVGSPLSDGHKHARALRLVSKAILRDLWIEARRIRVEEAE